MDQLRGYKTNCGFSVGKPRFGSIKVKIPRVQPCVAEKGKEIEEEDQVEEEEEDEAKSIGLAEEEEDDDHGARSMDLEEEDVEEEKKKRHICCECGREFCSGVSYGPWSTLFWPIIRNPLETWLGQVMPKPIRWLVSLLREQKLHEENESSVVFSKRLTPNQREREREC